MRHTDNFQFAYKEKSSTTCALIHVHNIVTNLLETDNNVGVALLSLDYSKAFDTILHNKLIAKLKEKSFPINVLSDGPFHTSVIVLKMSALVV